MVTIRSMTSSDVDAVAKLEASIFSQPWSRQGFLDALRMEHAVFLVAQDEEEVVGYIGMYCSLDEGEITNVAVDSRKRCMGIGGMLIAAMKQEATQRGIAQIVLEVRVSNESAIHLYEKNGFVNQGIRKGFYELPKEDAYIMICGQ